MRLCGFEVGADRPFFLIAGPCVVEDEALVLDIAGRMQELTAEQGLGAPHYEVSETGPDHDKRFTARVRLTDGLHGHGTGATKKDAEQSAARTTFAEIRERG